MSTPQPQDTVDIQISLLKSALREEGIEVEAARLPDGSLDYLYEVGVILVRHGYLGEVRAVLSEHRGEPGSDESAGQDDEKGRPDPGFIPGVTLLSLAPYNLTVPVALDLIDREIGEGVATPNHILSITPVHCCPASEPVVVPADTQPDPGVCDCGGAGVLIYAPDTGFIEAAAREHPWLGGITGDRDESVGQGAIKEYGGHGTFVAGVARCMAPVSTVFVSNDFTKAGAISEHKIVVKLNQALRRGADIISLSAGGATRKDLPLLGFEAFWDRYRHYKNVVLVAAAGNNSSRRPFWPAAFPEVVSVGALSADGRARAHFSDFGPWVDVYAPGEDLINAYATGTYEYREPPNTGKADFHGMARWSGTSFATPLVAGLIAARMSRTGETGRLAARALLAAARAQHITGVGPVLRPCDTGDVDICRVCCGAR